ncbi:MAG TPA: DUF1648 domain-containing protein [Dissulfurispiraceae bacterium]|nr:DUF1648 domain-containing protein [Dissulfurispiraceae bacterium]
MGGLSWAKYLFFMLVCLCLLHAAYGYLMLPETVASHFNAAGIANAWASKKLFIGIYAGAAALCSGLFGTMGALFARMPESMINLPHREYWLSPERRGETFAFLELYGYLFGASTLVLLLFVFHQAFRVSLGHISALEHMPAALGTYLVVSLGLTVIFIGRFMRRPEK